MREKIRLLRNELHGSALLKQQPGFLPATQKREKEDADGWTAAFALGFPDIVLDRALRERDFTVFGSPGAYAGDVFFLGHYCVVHILLLSLLLFWFV